MIFDSLCSLIGRTPLLRLESSPCEILVKLESFNPGGSAKDRVALKMIEDAEAAGVLKPSGTIVEPTSGNTGVGLAWIGKNRGYKVVLCMPENMSKERILLLKAYGAQVELTPASDGMKGAIAKAESLLKEIPGSWMPLQFSNPSNPAAHRQTAEEIWNDSEGGVDIFVATVGTGGTLCGTARELKKYKPSLVAVAVEPAESPLLTKGHAGPHKIQGIGANFVPENYDGSIVDAVLDISGDEATAAARLLASKGILCGISSGAAYAAALKLAQEPSNKGKRIVALLPDTGERYLSTDLFE